MVNRLVEPGRAVEGALALAGQVAANAPLALRTSKWILTRATGRDDQDLWREQEERAAAIMLSHDALEGATAFAEKREPRWTGR